MNPVADDQAVLLETIERIRGVRDGALDPTLRWPELGLDSLDVVEVLATAEEQFGVIISDAVGLRLQSPAQLVEWLGSADRQ
jgi:acyl carrier protein